MTQAEALAILKTGLNVFLTGEPGAGKTHTINLYVKWLRERGIDPAVCASTGVAATHLGGMTIHAWSGIGVKRDLSDYDIELIQSREKTALRIVHAKVLIIDEISMLDARALENVDRVLRTLRRKPLQGEEPFGGLQVIFVGDFFQLPPVSRGEEAKFAFESRAWKEANPVMCYLEEQHRQEDDEFLELLSAMRHGSLDTKHRNALSGRSRVVPGEQVATRLYTHNDNVDRLNARALEALAGNTHVFEMTSRGAKVLVEALKNQCLSPETLQLKEGAAVMFTRNNFEVGYVNGTLGTVAGFDPLGAPIVTTRSGSVITVEPAEWAIQDGNKILARIAQVPLRLAWAITVHKSQGMSLDAAIIDLSQAFEYGQGYVALSRVRTMKGLFLEGYNERALELHPKVAAADRHFRAYSAAARKKFASLPDTQKETMEQNFLRAIGAEEPTEERAGDADIPKNKLDVLREKYPNAGRAWSKKDDETLKELFADGAKQATMAKRFGRKPSAIRARLGHLGLIDDYWAGKKRDR